MDILPNGISVALYAIAAVCAVAMATVWLLMKRAARNAGFASKALLKRQLSAAAVLKATEIRPSLARGVDRPHRTAVLDLAKKRSVTR
ncbi:hypothetical protein [Streptomyces sp. CBMA123]|uniref:hypothetical protein n=1 Tax=Streptomyces sp. CBMA123 TaxID=1896313 RepID=UPI001661CB6A|nr:hypothetical protein [Streptomyces sp. CBMA123]MBD0689388.1 hypothetical protein [Streptomyces sp. CBMA123]